MKLNLTDLLRREEIQVKRNPSEDIWHSLYKTSLNSIKYGNEQTIKETTQALQILKEADERAYKERAEEIKRVLEVRRHRKNSGTTKKLLKEIIDKIDQPSEIEIPRETNYKMKYINSTNI